MEIDDANKLNQSLQQYFNLPAAQDGYDALISKLTEEVQYLIDYDLNKLWALLYRIDVYEKKVKEVIATTPFTEHARRIAELIIERQQEKIISRKKYK